ncbi:uncharacterized protein LOC118179432 [Stegodyphus dumicola]|uniref:uncharacterized protein LOC118179432 n=1 Tax=Stegodyphus dumicola TaxID=202533 RepID=UPI0015B20A7E|nr:uncharacterized protein LOC118179432 [Stegodyphus dumicola]
MGFGDDAYGIETGVDPWIQNLWPALCKQLGVPFVSSDSLHASLNKFTSNISATFASILNNLKMSCDEEQSSEHTLLTDALLLILKDFDVEKCRTPRLPSPALAISFEETHKVS